MAGVAEVMNIIGEVAGRTCLLVDDMVDTAGFPSATQLLPLKNMAPPR